MAAQVGFEVVCVKSRTLIDSQSALATPQLVVDKETARSLGNRLRRFLERGEHDDPLIKSEREQLHLFGQAAFEPFRQVVYVGSSYSCCRGTREAEAAWRAAFLRSGP